MTRIASLTGAVLLTVALFAAAIVFSIWLMNSGVSVLLLIPRRLVFPFAMMVNFLAVFVGVAICITVAIRGERRRKDGTAPDEGNLSRTQLRRPQLRRRQIP